MIVFFVSFSYTHAWEEYEKNENKASLKMEERQVIEYDFALEIEVEEDGLAYASWDEFDIEWFDWFKLVYSTTNTAPVYPHDTTIFVGNADQTESSFKLKRGMNYVRICAVVLNDDYSKDRYCGEVQKIEFWDSDAVPDESDYEKKKEYDKKDEYKKSYESKKQEVKKKIQAKKMYLSKSLKERIDELLENFIENLEDRDYSDEKIIETIDIVLERLENYKENDKFAAIVSYMGEVLRKYRAEYDNVLNELDDIFSDL